MSVLPLRNPATGETFGSVTEASPAQVDAAVAKARLAFEAWSATSLSERLRYLTRLRHYLVEHGEELAEKISQATGKVTIEAYMTEIFVTADTIRFYEKHARKCWLPSPCRPRSCSGRKNRTFTTSRWG